MVKKRKYHKGIPVLLIIGVIIIAVFYIIYGWKMLLRYMLGAIMFATVTVALVRWLNGKLGRKRVKL